MDISVRTVEHQSEDRSWLGSAHGTDATRTITLDVSTFTENTHYPNGFIPSGVVLGRISATGKYGPYDNGASDGRQVAAGHLFNSTTVPTDTTVDVGAPLLEHGAVVEANLPTGHGLDSNGKTDLAGRIIYR